MLQLCYLVFEVADVLARICVVQLALDLSFFFLLGQNTQLSNMFHSFWKKKRILLIIYRVKNILDSWHILYILLNQKGSVEMTLMSSCLWLKTPAQAGEITQLREPRCKKSGIAQYPARMAGDQGDRCLVKHKQCHLCLISSWGPGDEAGCCL